MSHRLDGPARPLPSLYGDKRRWALIQAEATRLLAELPAGSVDAVVTDPPYGLGFHGETWDSGTLSDGAGFAAFTRWWAEPALRALKPGGYLAAFGAPRTVHRLIAGLEAAGFEIRDQLLWLFGSGVPKSRRMPGGLGSALKPAYEPIVLARRPLDRAAPTIADNLARHGTGALNIAASRLPKDGSEEGYWPASVALAHLLGCHPRRGECIPDCVVPLIDRLAAPHRSKDAAAFSRLFYAAKASRAEREAGLDRLPEQTVEIYAGSQRRPRRNPHPTVKPIDLMRWIVRLVAPPGGVVLDPFAGSGSTGIAAVLEGRPFVGIEREADYVTVARARLAHWTALHRRAGSPA